MDNKQDKFSNVDDYDLILEEKEKELKKEKRNKRILASSLLLLLLLGSTAVVAPIISVAVNNKNNSANINNIKIPSTFTFTDADITKLINSYKSEIQNKKLSFDEFQTNFINITKQYIFVGNTPIGSIVKSATITQNSPTDDYIISIVLDENKQYLSEQLTLATLNNNELLITLKYSEKALGDFFTPIDISDKLNQLPELIENWIKDNQFTKEEFENAINDGTLKSEIVNLLKPNVNSNQIGNIKYEEPNLIIEPKHPDKFSPSDSSWIVDGNIVIPISKFYKTIKFSNLDKLYNALNSIIHTNNKHYTPDEFKEYIAQNISSMKELIYNNLEFSSDKFDINDILNVSLDSNDQLVIKLKDLSDNYLKYEIESSQYFEFTNNQLIVKDLDFLYLGSPSSWFLYYYLNGKRLIIGLTDEGEKQSEFKIPREVDGFYLQAFQGYKNIVKIDMSLMKTFYNEDLENNILAKQLFRNCTNLKEVIFPKNANIKKFGDGVFYNCSNLKTLNFPNNLEIIGSECFYGAGINKFILPNSLKRIEGFVFDNQHLNLISLSSETDWLNYPLTYFSSSTRFKIYVPTEELKQYYLKYNTKNSQFERYILGVIVGEPPAN